MGVKTAYRNANGVERRVRALGGCEVDLGVRGEDCMGAGENGWDGDTDNSTNCSMGGQPQEGTIPAHIHSVPARNT